MFDMQPGDRRDLNQTLVLAALRRNGPLSRADLSRLIGLSPPTIGDTVRRLQRRQMIHELDLAPSSGGRPGQLLGIVPTAAQALGVKISYDHITIVTAHLSGEVDSTETIEFDATAPHPANTLTELLSPRFDHSAEALLGIGVCVPGTVASPDTGVVDSPVLGWSQLPLGRQLRGSLGVPVLVENDVKALAIAEQLYGVGREADSFLILTLGRGIGCAISEKHQLIRGHDGTAGEISHLKIEGSDLLCVCGERGCLQASIGTEGLLRAARQKRLIRKQQDIEDLQLLAESGNTAARRIFTNAGALLGRVLAPILIAVAPAEVVIAGEGATQWDLWAAGFGSSIRTLLPRQPSETVTEIEHDWTDANWALGAAALLLATLFAAEPPSGHQTAEVLTRLSPE